MTSPPPDRRPKPVPTTTRMTPEQRLAAIAKQLDPCPPPDIFAGFDLCPCGYGGAWPCSTTQAVWLAAGLDPALEARRIVNDMRPADNDY